MSEHLRADGHLWDSVSHLTATTTLAKAVRATDQVGLPLATLMDLVVMPGLPGEAALGLDQFPSPGDLEEGERHYQSMLREWQAEASGRRMRTGIQVDDSLRRFVRTAGDPVMGRALVASRREYARTVHSLVNAGVRPEGLRPRDRLGALAAQAWTQAEVDVPELGAPRELLWVDLDDLEHQSTSEARDLLARVRAALRAAFGPAPRYSIVHHGFYFFTPPQWALFQVLRRVPEVDQLFVVHDDGDNPAFDTWRHYFRSEWDMPVPQVVPSSEDVTPAARALRDILTGSREGALDAVTILECRSPSELVRAWASEDQAAREEAREVRRFAARAKDVERFAQRLGHWGDTSAPRLSQLPVGSFLLAMHGCIRQRPDGLVSTHLTGEALLDMLASGYLGSSGDVEPLRVPVLRRVLPYFSDCRTLEQWSDRAALLRRTVRDRVWHLGGRSADDADVERIDSAAGNLARLVPWADLTLDEAASVEATVTHVARLVSEVAAHERVVLDRHLHAVRGRLQHALQVLPDSEREVIDAKLRGFSVNLDDEIDVGGLVDVVAMLLGRTADFDTAAPDEDPESTDVAQLRGLDALGLQRSAEDLHIANLAEDVFPGTGGGAGWPFDLEDLRRSGVEAADPVTVGLLETRAATTALSDLYLFWLALDGVSPGHRVTLSWVSDAGGEKRRPSPILSLLSVPDVKSAAIKHEAGGIEIETPRRPADHLATRERPDPAEGDVDPDDLGHAVDQLAASATAAALACPRRFAIQWGTGPTAAFGPDYLQTMLHGNLTNALVRRRNENQFGATATTNDLWAHLTEGQRRSSLAKAVVKPDGPSAGPEWLFTLQGTKNGHEPLDAAYQAALDQVPPDEDLIAPLDAGFLPVGVDDRKVCTACPVQARCLHWRDRDF